MATQIDPREPASVLMHATDYYTSHCSACHDVIPQGAYYFLFDTGKVACMSCAMGPELPAPVFDLDDPATFAWLFEDRTQKTLIPFLGWVLIEVACEDFQCWVECIGPREVAHEDVRRDWQCMDCERLNLCASAQREWAAA